MRRTFLSILLVVAAALPAAAGTYNYLTLVTGATARSVDLQAIKRITFSDGNLVVTLVDESQGVVSLSSLSSIRFTEEPTQSGVRSLGGQDVSLRMDGGRLVAEGTGVLTLYNANGQLVRQQNVRAGHGEMSLVALARGIYIARFGNRTLKIAY